MKRLIVVTLALTQLSLFGASYEKVAIDAADPVKPFNVYKLIAVTQGESKMPYQIAYRSIGANKLFACLVADPQLDEIFPDVAIAQEIVDAIPEWISGGHIHEVKDARDKVQLSKICTQALKEGKVKSRLMGLFVFAKTLSNSAGSEGAEITLNNFWNDGSKSWSRWSSATVAPGTEALGSIKVDSAGAVVFKIPLSNSGLKELHRRGEFAAIHELWTKKLETNGHDFAFKIATRDVEEYFAHQASIAQAKDLSVQTPSAACSTCSVL